MKIPQKINRHTVLLAFFSALSWGASVVHAQSNAPTLLPRPLENQPIGGGGTEVCANLPDLIKSGDIHLSSIPCFIKYFTQTLVGVACSLAVVFVMIGGYKYVLGREEDKETAKKTITYALIGLAVTLMAWIIIDLVLTTITG